MVESGEKTEEYRDLTPRYAKMLCGCPANIDWCHEPHATCKGCSILRRLLSKHKQVTFQRAYPKNPPRMTWTIKDIIVGEGRKEWGAEEGEEYFVIRLGKRV